MLPTPALPLFLVYLGFLVSCYLSHHAAAHSDTGSHCLPVRQLLWHSAGAVGHRQVRGTIAPRRAVRPFVPVAALYCSCYNTVVVVFRRVQGSMGGLFVNEELLPTKVDCTFPTFPKPQVRRFGSHNLSRKIWNASATRSRWFRRQRQPCAATLQTVAPWPAGRLLLGQSPPQQIRRPKRLRNAHDEA